MVFILKVNNTQEKKFETHCLRVPEQFLINTVRKRGNTNAESKTMQIFQIMNNCDWLINVNRNMDQNQLLLGATPYSLWVVFYFIVFTKILKYTPISIKVAPVSHVS